MENEELLQHYHAMQHFCAEHQKAGTGKECILYGVCIHRDCEPKEHPLSKRINKAMLTGEAIEYNGARYDYITGYSKRTYRKKGKREHYFTVELMDICGHSTISVPPEMVRFPADEADIVDTGPCVSCGALIPEGRQVCPICEAKARVSP